MFKQLSLIKLINSDTVDSYDSKHQNYDPTLTKDPIIEFYLITI